MDNLKLIVGLSLTAAAAVGLILTWIGSRFGKSTGAWGAILATAIVTLVACRPLTGGWAAWPTTDPLLRGVWLSIPLSLLAIVLSFKKIPIWVRAIATLAAPAAALAWIFMLYPPPSDTTQHMFLLTWAGIPAGVVLILWLLIEPIAARTAGITAPLVIGFLFAGLGLLDLMSSSTKPGNLIAGVGAVTAGAAVAAILSKQICFARGPVFLWIAILAILYVPSCYDADSIPYRPLMFILGAPLLAWPMEIKFLKRWKPWKRELLRGLLVAAPTLFGIYLGYQQMKANGDGDAVLWPAHHPAAPMCPSQMPIPKTINPPTIT